jgi:Fe2+ or Zn2+ uptake regulation protein
MIHGHYQCAECGKIQDGDCCQGETGAKERDNKYKENRIRSSVDTNFEASDY